METIPNDAGRRFMIVLNRACPSADISLVRMTVSALIAVSFASCALATDYCSNIQNLPPLVDLGPGQTYQGYEGGLYPGGSNVRPAAHDAAGRKIAQSIVLLDANGNPDHVNGKIVYTIESLSNGFPMWHTGEAGYDADTSVTFMTRANADPTKNPQLSIAHGFEYQLGGERDASDPNNPFYQSIDVGLQQQGLTPQQVQVIYLFLPFSTTTLGVPAPPENQTFPNDARIGQSYIKEAVRASKTHFPNLKIIYVSTKGYTYALPNYSNGIAVPGGPVEPWNHDMGWAVKWMIESQINGDPSLNYDPARGAVNAPWISWGPYFWTYGDGTPRAYDGFSWNCGDVYDDGIHLNHSGMYKEVSLLLAQMRSDPTATPWFLASGEVPPPVEPPPRLRKH